VKLYYIEWEDSVGLLIDAWRHIEDIPLKMAVCVSVGYEIGRTSKAITLASSLDFGHDSCRGIITVPLSAIRKKRILPIPA